MVFSEIKEAVGNISVIEIVRQAGIEIKKRNNYWVCQCPFHHDKNPSMMIKPHFFHCYGCGLEGDGIEFIENLYGIDFKEAVYKIAVDHGLISFDECDELKEKKYIKKEMERPIIKKEEEKAPQKADEKTLNIIYSALVDICPLTKEHLTHLKTIRGLSDEQIKGNYFSINIKRDLMDNLHTSLYKRCSYEILKKNSNLTDAEDERIRDVVYKLLVVISKKQVPGLINIKNGIYFSTNVNGLGLVCRNTKNKILAIQIRNFQGDARYTWLSNSFYHGARSGTPGGVIYPSNPNKNPCVCVTEGRFKAEKIAEKGNIAIYVSGVSTWRNILSYMDEVKGTRETIFLMFDADLMGNPTVAGNLKSLADALIEKELNPVVVLWKKELGKGFDDLVLKYKESYTDALNYVSYEKFKICYDKWHEYLCQKYGVSTFSQLKDEDVKKFKGNLQFLIEKELVKNSL